MKVYKLVHNSIGYKSINLKGNKLSETIANDFYKDGRSHNLGEIILNWANSKGKEIICDFPFISGNIPVMSEKAYCVLQPLIEKSSVEIISLIIEGEKYFLLHFLNALSDVLNEKKSKIITFKNGNIQNISHYVFYPEVADKTPFFLIEQLKTFLFANEEVVNLVKANKLVGLNFEEAEIKTKSFF
jgi:hypothetical protein